MDKRLLYLKIAGVLVATYLLINFFARDIFIANTPRFRPNIDKVIAAKFGNVTSSVTQLAVNLFGQTPERQLKDVALQPVAKGIYAKQKGAVSQTIIKDNEVEMVEYEYNVNGKIVRIRVPKGQNPPPQNIVESYAE